MTWNFHSVPDRRGTHPETDMRFLIVRTDVRAAADVDLTTAWAHGDRLRDETVAPEPRRQVVHADDREAALLLARALAAVGAVRAGRQRVKVLPLDEPPSAWPSWPDDRGS